MLTQFSFGHASPLLSTGAEGPSLVISCHSGSYRVGWMAQWIRQGLYEVRFLLQWLSPGKSLPGRETNTGQKGVPGNGRGRALRRVWRLLRASVHGFLCSLLPKALSPSGEEVSSISLAPFPQITWGGAGNPGKEICVCVCLSPYWTVSPVRPGFGLS